MPKNEIELNKRSGEWQERNNDWHAWKLIWTQQYEKETIMCSDQ